MSIVVRKGTKQPAKTAPAESKSPRRSRATGAPSSPAQRKEFFTAAELAQRWQMSERHVRRLIKSGELDTHRFGRVVRISLAQLLIYEASRAQVG
jgi:excisionase family DNA binding protein